VRRNPVAVAGWRAAIYALIDLHAHGLQVFALWVDSVPCFFALANTINGFAEGEQEVFAPRPVRAPNLAETNA